METDFLVQRVRSASSLILMVTMLIAQTCAEGEQAWSAQLSRQVNAADLALKFTANTLLFEDHLYTGKTFTLNAKGDTTAMAEYRKGMEEGTCYAWYHNGQLKEERMYSKGKRIGIHRGWFANGQLKFRYHYENDLMHGLAEEWYASGKPCKVMHYKNGYEAGLQRMWDEDGSVRANYEARHGRNYGLTGTKNCANVWKDVDP